MTIAGAESVVVLSSIVTFGSVSADGITSGDLVPSGKRIALTCLAFGTLGVIAGFAPDIGGGLALCIAGTAFITSGLPAMSKLFGEGFLKDEG